MIVAEIRLIQKIDITDIKIACRTKTKQMRKAIRYILTL